MGSVITIMAAGVASDPLADFRARARSGAVRAATELRDALADIRKLRCLHLPIVALGIDSDKATDLNFRGRRSKAAYLRLNQNLATPFLDLTPCGPHVSLNPSRLLTALLQPGQALISSRDDTHRPSASRPRFGPV